MYPDYLKCVERFYKKLLPMLVPLLETNGGNIIAMQVENEYGSYGNDKEYLAFIEQFMRDCGIDVLYFTSDGNWKNMISGGSLDGMYKVLNFGSKAKSAFNCLKDFENNGPNMCGEFWCGWFDHWGERHHTRNAGAVEKEIKDFIDSGASFNFYMFHGGTNFGFTAGANFDKKYDPTVTRYDYCALLNEWGDYTPAYHKARDILCAAQKIEKKPLPPSPALQNIGRVKLTHYAKLFDNLENIGTRHRGPVPESMEYFGQNFGMIYYETILKGKYDISPLIVKDVHDFGYVYIDGCLKKRIDRTKYTARRTGLSALFGKSSPNKMLMTPLNGERKIGVLVDTMGRVNYGERIIDRKGITDIYIGKQRQMGYDVWTLPLDNLDRLGYSEKSDGSVPLFLKGSL